MSNDDVLLIPPTRNRGACIRLEPGVTVVGRSPDCDLVLPDLSVSRRHAELSVESTNVSVRDLNSQNGTFVGEQRIDQCKIECGQQLRFGNVAFLLATNSALGADPNSELETRKLQQSQAPQSIDGVRHLLSSAQRRVFDLLIEGRAEKQIAHQLELSRHTVHNHIRYIYKQFGVHSRSELLAKFVSGSDNTPTSPG